MKSETLSTEALPENRVIRKRFASSTTAMHVSALPPELGSLAPLVDADRYLAKCRIPAQVRVPGPESTARNLSKDEVWRLADNHGEGTEAWLLSGTSGKIAEFFSAHGHMIYANLGRPALGFSGFFHDHLDRAVAARVCHHHHCHCHLASTGPTAATVASGVPLGPLLIALDSASATGLTALGHVARGASIQDRSVMADVLSTGAY